MSTVSHFDFTLSSLNFNKCNQELLFSFIDWNWQQQQQSDEPRGKTVYVWTWSNLVSLATDAAQKLVNRLNSRRSIRRNNKMCNRGNTGCKKIGRNGSLQFVFYAREQRVLYEEKTERALGKRQEEERHFPLSFAFSNISQPGSSFCARLAWLKMERIKKDTSKVSASACYRALQCLINETWITGWSHCCR